MIVKICGIQTEEAAKVAVDAGADFIGFVFAESKRKLTPEKAAKITQVLPSTVKKVGVFVNETVTNMCRIAQTVGLDIIQLHGDETAEIAKQLPYEIIKATPIDQVNATLQTFPCNYYLIDSPVDEYRGGSGKTFDWNLLQQLEISPNKIILAGGLHPDNVKQAIQQVHPAGIDVSSGVETDGNKDHEKIRSFIMNAKDDEYDNL